ncbi:BREX-1 system adenine-specific DNA-methyltransferase PglX, partial [Bifidobacterium longum]
LSDIADVAQGVTTGDNARFLRFWWECYCRTIQFDRISLQETPLQRWVPCDKGGGFRRWSGNNEYIVDWTENGKKLFDFPGSTPRNREITFKNALACSKISSGQPSFRRRNHGFAYSDAAVALSDSTLLSELNCFLNSTTALTIMQALSPTLNFEVGQIRSLPCKFGISANWRDREKELVSASEKDWDSFETSWDFQRFTLLDPDQGAQAGNLLEDAVLHLWEYWHRVSEEQRQREIRNNEMVADAYGVRDDVPCDVPLERVSLKRNVAFAYPKDTPEVRNEKFAQDVVKELISYAVGCMFGRYSLDKPGLILASQGETLDDYHAQIPNPSFGPDADNVIPVTETDCFEDDIVTRFRRFLIVAFGKENLAANIAYIEQVLGKSVRKYFVNDFYNDHVKMYSNRPIYWQYSSQTNNKGSFKALVYLHRYTPKTTNVVLNYLRDYTSKIADIADGLERSDRTADQKQAAKLHKAVLECKDYEDQTLYPLATRNLEIDLDDGVLVNYLRMGKALRSIPAIEKKRKEVSTWTWPVHPLKD